MIPVFLPVWAVVMISATLSLMFPTIYGVALAGLGEDTKFGAAGLVMAIPGGALMPLVHGTVMDLRGADQSWGACLSAPQHQFYPAIPTLQGADDAWLFCTL
ncbi:hypothetical protein [Paracoccus amoyensis]|uniref:hypothetical protein n=1 Tax=Paracoccus amoyensis TaxID=2760093 RepID=UPI001CA8742E|nr:hypothetical protein [Paracoccus amoyensis]